MSSSSGGTNIYCRNCKSIQTCRMRTEYDSWSKGNDYALGHPDIRYFRRPRECLKCGFDFETYEINGGFIRELVLLRNFVKEMIPAINKITPKKIPKLEDWYPNHL